MKIQFLLKNTGLFERLGIMTLSSILKKHGHIVTLILTEELSDEECITNIKNFEPQILAYSIMTGEHNYHINLNQMIRSQYNCFSVFGGPHPTFKPDMIKKLNVDAICRGEGDIYFLLLIDRMEQGKDFYSIPNFWFKKSNGHIVRNKMGLLKENLDELPFPDRKLVYDVDPAIRSKGIRTFMAMRGCPYQCTYCFNHVYNKMTRGCGKTLRYRSVDSLIAEIKEVKENYFIDRIGMTDDTFLLKPKGWLEEFSEKITKEIGLPLSCTVRGNLVDERIGKLLEKMNCRHIWMGVECGNNEIATKILKRNISNEQILSACEILHKHQIKITTQNLIGLPVENSLEVDLETLFFNIKLKPYFGWSSILYPYPGTEISQLAVEKGLFKENFEKISISNKTESTLNFGDLKLQRKINNLHKLFGIVVQFPVLSSLIPFMISLPLTKLYTWLFFAFYGYKVLKSQSIRGICKSIRHYVVFYFKYVSRLERIQHFSDRENRCLMKKSTIKTKL